MVVEHNSSRAGETQGVRHVDSAAPERLHALLMDLVRATGLLQPDQTVPGQPESMSQAFALHELDIDTPLSQRDPAERLGLEKSRQPDGRGDGTQGTSNARTRSRQPAALPAAAYRRGPRPARPHGRHFS